MPYDVAFCLDDIDATAFSIIFGELNGAKFDWNAWRWKEEAQ